MNPVFRFSTWDFETILKTTAFIDRTLLLKTMFEENEKVLVIAPRLSGKSTNLNMARRFLGINIDEHGCRKEKSETVNYKLFVKNNLKVVNSENNFFHNHFGSFPVIFIDYHPLSVVKSFYSLIERYREIFLYTFQQHEYLTNNLNLWSNGNSKELFVMYCRSEGNFSLTKTEIKQGIPFLSKLLYEHFGQKVYILMDEYDALIDSPILKDSPDKNKIISFIHEVNSLIFKGNQYILRALVSGVTRYNSSRLHLPCSLILPDNVIEYHFKNYNPFCQYYGVTAEELDILLATFIEDQTKREEVKSIVAVKSESVEHKNILYNTWFVLRNLANLNKTYLQI